MEVEEQQRQAPPPDYQHIARLAAEQLATLRETHRRTAEQLPTDRKDADWTRQRLDSIGQISENRHDHEQLTRSVGLEPTYVHGPNGLSAVAVRVPSSEHNGAASTLAYADGATLQTRWDAIDNDTATTLNPTQSQTVANAITRTLVADTNERLSPRHPSHTGDAIAVLDGQPLARTAPAPGGGTRRVTIEPPPPPPPAVVAVTNSPVR